MQRPLPYLVGSVQGLLGAALVADAVFEGRIHDLGGWGAALGGMLVALVVAAGAATVRGRLRHLLVWGGLLLGAVAIAFPFLPDTGHPALARPPLFAGLLVLVVALVWLLVLETDRRTVRVTLEKERLVVALRRYRIEHALPLESVRTVRAARGPLGRLLGYGDLLATAKSGTMEENVTRPLVGEEPPEEAGRGNGWDTEGTFRLRAAHPYRRVQQALENRIALARLSPKERQEQELAYRLQEDLDDLHV